MKCDIILHVCLLYLPKIDFILLKGVKTLQAHKAFDISLYYNNQNIAALLSRSRLYQRYLQYDRATTDIDNALNVEPENLDTLQMQAQCQYLHSDFEFGLISDYRGDPLRKQPPIFQSGILQCREAIESCLGAKAGPMLRNFYYKIISLEAKKQEARDWAEKNRWKRRVAPKQARKQLCQKESVGPQIVVARKPLKLTGQINRTKKTVTSPVDNRKLIKPSYTQLDVKLGKPVENESDLYCPVQAKTTNIKNFVTEKYIERMRFDKQLLRYCASSNIGIDIPNKKGNNKIKTNAIRAFNECVTCQESLRSRNPFYAIRYREVEVIKSLYRKELEELLQVQKMNQSDADHFLAIVRTARENYQIGLCQLFASRAQDFFDRKNKRQLPRKDEYVEILANIIGLAYLDTLRLDPDAPPYISQKRVKFMLGLPISVAGSKYQDSHVEALKPPILDIKKEIEKTRNRVREARFALELAWLYYDLARYYIIAKRYEVGGHYASLCLQQSDAIANEVWAINSLFLMIKCFLHGRDRNSAQENCLETINRCKIIYYPNKDNLLEFMESALDVINELDYGELETTDAIKERQVAILKVVHQDQLKAQLNYLFKKMNTIPAIRRMSVMPGVVPTDKPGKKLPPDVPRRHTITNPNVIKTRPGLVPLTVDDPSAFLDLF